MILLIPSLAVALIIFLYFAMFVAKLASIRKNFPQIVTRRILLANSIVALYAFVCAVIFLSLLLWS